jgi:hypothetical protein
MRLTLESFPTAPFLAALDTRSSYHGSYPLHALVMETKSHHASHIPPSSQPSKITNHNAIEFNTEQIGVSVIKKYAASPLGRIFFYATHYLICHSSYGETLSISSVARRGPPHIRHASDNEDKIQIVEGADITVWYKVSHVLNQI